MERGRGLQASANPGVVPLGAARVDERRIGPGNLLDARDWLAAVGNAAEVFGQASAPNGFVRDTSSRRLRVFS